MVALAVSGCRSTGPNPESAPASDAFFQREVRPILELNCLACHNGRTLPGHLDLTTQATALAGRVGGRRFLVPRRPDDSLMLTAVSRRGTHPKLMPQRDLSLSEEDIGTLREWVEDGAHWPVGANGTLSPRPNPEVPRPDR
ncbi:MAG: c-type cytochrome domain-containing protein [Verrucomicrobiales bacterium]